MSASKKQNKSNIKIKDAQKINSITKIQQLTEKDKVQDFFHGIHNYMRNNGIGYGMDALKVFSLFFGLMSIEQKPKCLKLLKFDNKFIFSNILKYCEKESREDIYTFINKDLLDYLANDENNCRNLFFFEISKEIPGKILRDFINNKIKPLQKYITHNTNTNIQLNGKIYEYFIGRDKNNIEEFGAYFTDRYITLYISLKSPLQIKEDGTIPINIDMFGGSGGFTITNVEQLINDAKEKNIKINWKKEIKKIFHFDMNPDVVKHAAFETFLLLEQIPDYENNFRWANSFKDNKISELSKNTDVEIRTNPPYGGDSFDKQVGQIAQFIKMLEFIKQQITTILVELFKHFNINKFKLTLNNKIIKSKKYADKAEYFKLFNRFNNMIKKHYNNTITNSELQSYINNEIKIYFKSDITNDKLNKQLIKFIKMSENKLLFENSIKKLEDKHKKEDIVSLHSSSDFIKQYTKKIKNYNFKEKHNIVDPKLLKKYNDPSDKEAISLILLMATIQNGGRCVAILKEGVFFNDTYRYLRAYLCCNFEVEYVTSVDQKAFENTATKTSIICFKNTGKSTTSIKFYDLLVIKQEEDKIELDENYFPIVKRNKGDIINFENKDINEMEKFVSEASFDELIKNNFNLQGKTYETKVELIPGDDFKIVKLEDICEFSNGYQLDKKNIIKGEYPVFGGGKTYLGKHNNFNRENSIIISGTGNYSGFVNYYKFKFWASQCFTLKPFNINNIKLIYNICKLFENSIMNTNGGSAQKFIRGNNLKTFKIPIPKTDELMDFWTKKISTPFDKMNEKEAKIKSIEEEIETEVKRIIDEEECIDTKLEDICEFKRGKNLTKNEFKNGIYPVIGGGQTPTGYHNKFNTHKNIITCSSSGNYAGFINKFNVEIWMSDCFSINSKVKIINNDLLFKILKLEQLNIYKLQEGSAQPHIYIKDLEKFKIPIPKNPDVLKSLDPKFKKLETIRISFEKYKSQYEEALEELKTASIKSV